MADSTAVTVCSGALWNTPRPIAGICTPLFNVRRGFLLVICVLVQQHHMCESVSTCGHQPLKRESVPATGVKRPRHRRDHASLPAIWNGDSLGAFDEDERGVADEGDTGRT